MNLPENPGSRARFLLRLRHGRRMVPMAMRRASPIRDRAATTTEFRFSLGQGAERPHGWHIV
jgi:hypothetical protein